MFCLQMPSKLAVRYIAIYRDRALACEDPRRPNDLPTIFFISKTKNSLADMSNVWQYVSYNIYSMDIDPLLIADQAIKLKLKPDNLTFVEGDCFAIEKAFNPDFLTKASHPLVLIEDAHHNTEAILHYFHEYRKPGDYIIVEDTHPDVPVLGGMFAKDPNYKTFMGQVNYE